MTVPKSSGTASLWVFPEDEHKGQQPVKALSSFSNRLVRLVVLCSYSVCIPLTHPVSASKLLRISLMFVTKLLLTWQMADWSLSSFPELSSSKYKVAHNIILNQWLRGEGSKITQWNVEQSPIYRSRKEELINAVQNCFLKRILHIFASLDVGTVNE